MCPIWGSNMVQKVPWLKSRLTLWFNNFKPEIQLGKWSENILVDGNCWISQPLYPIKPLTAGSTQLHHRIVHIQPGILTDPLHAYCITQKAYLSPLRLVKIIYIWWSTIWDCWLTWFYGFTKLEALMFPVVRPLPTT